MNWFPLSNPGAPKPSSMPGRPPGPGFGGFPFAVKPNGAEMASLFGKEEMSDSERIRVLREWNRRGIPLACVTLGKRGPRFVGGARLSGDSAGDRGGQPRRIRRCLRCGFGGRSRPGRRARSALALATASPRPTPCISRRDRWTRTGGFPEGKVHVAILSP